MNKKKKVKLVSFKIDSSKFNLKTNYQIQNDMSEFDKKGRRCEGIALMLWLRELNNLEIKSFGQNRIKLNKIKLFNLN